MEYVQLFVVLGQGGTSGISIAIGLGRFAPHLAVATSAMRWTMPRLSGLISQPRLETALWAMCSARSPLRSNSGKISNMPTRCRRTEVVIFSWSSCRHDQQLDLSGQVIHHLIPIDHTKPSGGVIVQQCMGRSCQCIRDEGEELGHPDVYELKLRWFSFHIPSRLPAQITKSSRVVRVKFTFGLFFVHPRQQELACAFVAVGGSGLSGAAPCGS